MMHHDQALSASGSSADAAAIAVSSEHLLPQTAEIFLILPLERVARGTHAQCENFPASTTPVKCPLNTDPNLLHFPLSFSLKKSFSFLGTASASCTYSVYTIYAVTRTSSASELQPDPKEGTPREQSRTENLEHKEYLSMQFH